MKKARVLWIGGIISVCFLLSTNSFGLKYLGEFHEVEITIQSIDKVEELKRQGVRYFPDKESRKYPEKYIVCIPVKKYTYLQQKGYTMKIIVPEQATQPIEISPSKISSKEGKWLHHTWTEQRNGIDYDDSFGDVQSSGSQGGYSNGVVLSYGWPSGWAEWTFNPPIVYGEQKWTEFILYFYGKDTENNGPDLKVWNFVFGDWGIWATGATEQEYGEGFYPAETPPAYYFVDWNLPHRIRFRLHATNVDCSWIKYVKCVFKYKGSWPILANLSVTPTSGSPGTNFTWKVQYGDGENDSPTVKQLSIKFPDGNWYDYTMSLSSGQPHNGWYTFQKTLSDVGIYESFCLFEDEYDGGPQKWYDNIEVTSAAEPDIAIDPTTWEYGDVYVGSHSDKTFLVSNNGNADLHVNGTEIGGTCADQFSIISGGGYHTVSPSSSYNIIARFAPTFVGDHQWAIIRIFSDDSDEDTLLVPIHGDGTDPEIPDIRVSPTSFDVTLQSGSTDKTLTIYNDGDATLTWSMSESPSVGWLSESPTSGSVSASGSENVTVTFDASGLSYGDYSTTLVISNNDPDENPKNVSVILHVGQQIVVIDTIPTTGFGPNVGIVALPDGNYVYVTHGSSVSAIRTSDNTVVNDILVGDSPMFITSLPNGSYVYVANSGSKSVSVIRTSDNVVVATIGVGTRPMGIAALPNGNYVYVTNSIDFDGISIIRTADNTLSNNIPTYPPYFVACITPLLPNGDYLYVSSPNQNTVGIISSSDNMINFNVSVGGVPIGITSLPNGSYVYVANSDSTSNSVSVIRTSDNTVIATVPVGKSPMDVASSPDGNYVYVTNFGSDNVSIIDVPSNSVVATVGVGNRPYGICANPVTNNVYVACFTGVWVLGYGVGTEEGSQRMQFAAYNLDISPNPFMQSTTIRYQLPVESKVSLEIYDIVGKKVETLVDGERNIGRYNVNWSTKGLANGLYFVKLAVHYQTDNGQAGNYKATRKLTILR